MNAIPAIMLVLTIITGEDKPNIVHKEPMSDLQACLEDAAKFLRHRLPDAVEAEALSANCVIRQNEEHAL